MVCAYLAFQTKQGKKDTAIEQEEADSDTRLFLLAAEAWIKLFNRARALAETKQADLRRTVANSTVTRTGE